MFTKENFITLDQEFQKRTKELFETLRKIENIIVNEKDLTESQLVYLIDARAKYKVAIDTIGSLEAGSNDLLDPNGYDPDYNYTAVMR